VSDGYSSVREEGGGLLKKLLDVGVAIDGVITIGVFICSLLFKEIKVEFKISLIIKSIIFRTSSCS
jgi:hypothetical protein